MRAIKFIENFGEKRIEAGVKKVTVRKADHAKNKEAVVKEMMTYETVPAWKKGEVWPNCSNSLAAKLVHQRKVAEYVEEKAGDEAKGQIGAVKAAQAQISEAEKKAAEILKEAKAEAGKIKAEATTEAGKILANAKENK